MTNLDFQLTDDELIVYEPVSGNPHHQKVCEIITKEMFVQMYSKWIKDEENTYSFQDLCNSALSVKARCKIVKTILRECGISTADANSVVNSMDKAIQTILRENESKDSINSESNCENCKYFETDKYGGHICAYCKWTGIGDNLNKIR